MFYKIALVGLLLNLSSTFYVLGFNANYSSSNSKDKITFNSNHPEKPFENLHQVADNLFRSEQPNQKGMIYLKEQNFKIIINLREKQRDVKLADGENFTFIHYPIVTWKIDETDILHVMQILKGIKGKALIHCKHGSDRTGCMVAAFRMVFQDWSKEEALAELRKDEFGYHEFWFPDIAQLIENLDVNKMKKDLGIFE